MLNFIKITPFNCATADFSESVKKTLDDVETAGLLWKLTIVPDTASTDTGQKS